MKNKSIIFIGIIVAVIICSTQLSGFTSIFTQYETSKRQQIRNVSEKQIHNFNIGKRKPVRRYCLI